MNAEPTIVMGTLKPDGILELDEKLSLPAGRVRVTVEPVTAGEVEDPLMARLEAIWAGQKARGHVPRSVEEVEAERRALREEFEKRVNEAERIHRECKTARRKAEEGGGSHG
jgi:hypothetical protein